MKLIWGGHTNNPDLPLLVRWKTKGGDARGLNRAGIFIIRNVVNDKMYIGHTAHLQYRYDLLSELLENNMFKDVCYKLQAEYNLYGRDNIHFIPREVCLNRKITRKRFKHISGYYKGLKGEDKLYKFDFSQIRSILKNLGDSYDNSTGNNT